MKIFMKIVKSCSKPHRFTVLTSRKVMHKFSNNNNYSLQNPDEYDDRDDNYDNENDHCNNDGSGIRTSHQVVRCSVSSHS